MDENQEKEETKQRIYNYLKEGMFKKDAAIMAGISEATLYRWLEEDESFKSRVEAGILEYKHSLVKIINTCADKDGRLVLEVLSRRFPSEWGVNANLGSNNDSDKATREIADLLQNMYAETHNQKVVDHDIDKRNV